MTADPLRLDEFIRLSASPSALAKAIIASGVEGERVVLSSENARTALMRYLLGRLDLDQLRLWGRVLHGRSDIDFEVEREVELRELLAELAGEMQFGELDAEVWVSRLDWT